MRIYRHVIFTFSVTDMQHICHDLMHGVTGVFWHVTTWYGPNSGDAERDRKLYVDDKKLKRYIYFYFICPENWARCERELRGNSLVPPLSHVWGVMGTVESGREILDNKADPVATSGGGTNLWDPFIILFLIYLFFLFFSQRFCFSCPLLLKTVGVCVRTTKQMDMGSEWVIRCVGVYGSYTTLLEYKKVNN